VGVPGDAYLTQAEAQDTWTTVPQAHKCYDSFRNEWDFNAELDPMAAEGEGDGDGYEDDYDDDYEVPQPTITATHFQDDLMTPTDNTIESHCKTESLDQLLSFQYGFVLPDDGHDYYPVECPLLPWDKARSVLSNRESPLEDKYKYPVTCFLSCFLTHSASFRLNLHALQCIWDLHDHCPSAVCHQEPNFCAGFKITKFSDGQIHYRLHRSAASPPWDLFLERATDVLECLKRAWGPKPEDLVEAFLARGIPFFTLLPHTPSLPSTIPQPPELGRHPVGYQPDTADYIRYEQICDEFLHGPRGRVALMQGGIAWRLARDVLDDSVVMVGPTPLNIRSKILKTSDGHQFYDDSFLEAEEFLICGGHRVKVDQCETTADMSWWPKPLVWASCGFNVGFWSELCEDWFQHRLAEIRNGTAKLCTSKKWKNALARYSHTKTFVKHTEILSAAYILGNRFP
jgi:hypothetical protein